MTRRNFCLASSRKGLNLFPNVYNACRAAWPSFCTPVRSSDYPLALLLRIYGTQLVCPPAHLEQSRPIRLNAKSGLAQMTCSTEAQAKAIDPRHGIKWLLSRWVGARQSATDRSTGSGLTSTARFRVLLGTLLETGRGRKYSSAWRRKPFRKQGKFSVLSFNMYHLLAVTQKCVTKQSNRQPEVPIM
ncbi:unnamed protein product [Protopolystoma xenopodis]|uniref:Uncharacterized protein n=1 Tax=Protopolystoma xenopodis TaxID=117903 RepID=A0A3S5BP45_9PLAT|nr:unnamed protein product [Protopolystoma xenopodis]